ncbi:MAG: hypothetical protein ABSA02_16615 [Trebonia sp.]|jgi:hypothetical protein
MNAGQAIRFSLAALAAWRITHLLVAEDGPAALVARARSKLGSGPAGELADCFGCMSMWVAAPLVPFVTRRRAEVPVCWLALSGAAFLLERRTQEPEAVVMLPPAEPEP